MKRSYYYFIASLPSLSFAQPKPVSYEHFLFLCASFLQKKDFTIIKDISLAPMGDEAVPIDAMKKWLIWDRAFREELALLRATGLGRQFLIEERKESAAAAHAAMMAKEIFGISSPLEADEQIDRAKWRYIESLEFEHYFDIEWLALYSLKLQILERRERFDEKEGLMRLDNMRERAKENYETERESVEAELD